MRNLSFVALCLLKLNTDKGDTGGRGCVILEVVGGAPGRETCILPSSS